MTETEGEANLARLEQRLHQLAASFSYPETPDLTIPFRPRPAASAPRRAPRLASRLAPRLAPRLAGAIVLALLLIVAAVPPVRAAVGEVLRVGVVRIFQGQAATPAAQGPQEVPAGALTVLDLPGETDLATARSAVDFELKLPAALGSPDRVFLLDETGPAVVMVWVDPDQPDRPQAALYTFPPSSALMKRGPESIKQVELDGRDALWAEGPHTAEIPLGDRSLRLYVPGGVLIWTEGPLTYRLETTEPLERALQIAASIP